MLEGWTLEILWKLLGLLALFAGPTVTWLIARRSQQSGIEAATDEARNVATKQAFEVAAEIRAELRVEIAGLKASLEGAEREIGELKAQLAQANETIAREAGRWEAFKSMWCPKADCPVLLRRRPAWDGTERREPPAPPGRKR